MSRPYRFGDTLRWKDHSLIVMVVSVRDDDFSGAVLADDDYVDEEPGEIMNWTYPYWLLLEGQDEVTP